MTGQWQGWEFAVPALYPVSARLAIKVHDAHGSDFDPAAKSARSRPSLGLGIRHSPESHARGFLSVLATNFSSPSAIPLPT
jgi:hypothetical protein